MVLQNFIVLQNDTPAVIHAVDHAFVDKDIMDPLTRKPKTVTTLEFQVDSLNGEPVNTSWSVISEKLASMLEPFLEDRRYRNFNFIVTKRGSGFMTDFEFRAVPRG